MRELVNASAKQVRSMLTVGDSGQSALALMALVGVIAGSARAILGRSDKTRWFDVVVAGGVSGLVSCTGGAYLVFQWGEKYMPAIYPICLVIGWIALVLLDTVGGIALRSLHNDLLRLLPPEAPAPPDKPKEP
jgi:hypothetical protein